MPNVINSVTNNDTLDTSIILASELAYGKRQISPITRKSASLYARKYIDLESTDALPTLEYRLLALFRIWNSGLWSFSFVFFFFCCDLINIWLVVKTVNYFFAYKKLMDNSWEDILLDFIPKFEEAKTGK